METPLGTHCILELKGCSASHLNDADFIQAALHQASKVCNSTLLKYSYHQFSPQGITAFALLAESHISIHTWPELGYAAVDVFTCGVQCDPSLACEYLIEQFEATSHAYSQLNRGESVQPTVTANSLMSTLGKIQLKENNLSPNTRTESNLCPTQL